MLSGNIIIGPLRRVVSYHDAFGWGGTLAFLSHQLVGYPREITGQPKGIPQPVHVRVGTSDAHLYYKILLRDEYALNLPFTPRTIVDAGANIGLTSIYYAQQYPRARVISVEAEATNFAILSRNVSSYPGIVPIHAALWKSDGLICVSERSSDSGKWGFITHEGAGAKVRAITMQTLMHELNIESIDLLKVDIEGAEIELFDGREWVDKVQALAIELHDRFRPGCSAAVNAAMSGFSASEHADLMLYLRAGLRFGTSMEEGTS